MRGYLHMRTVFVLRFVKTVDFVCLVLAQDLACGFYGLLQLPDQIETRVCPQSSAESLMSQLLVSSDLCRHNPGIEWQHDSMMAVDAVSY
jgi:hypothetical protein